MTSPSSQPIRSRSYHERCTALACPPHGQDALWASLALQTACMFLADASTLMAPIVASAPERQAAQRRLAVHLAEPTHESNVSSEALYRLSVMRRVPDALALETFPLITMFVPSVLSRPV